MHSSSVELDGSKWFLSLFLPLKVLGYKRQQLKFFFLSWRNPFLILGTHFISFHFILFKETNTFILCWAVEYPIHLWLKSRWKSSYWTYSFIFLRSVLLVQPWVGHKKEWLTLFWLHRCWNLNKHFSFTLSWKKKNF